ncbi:hypothetical protein HID58_037130 [Brassica napus]|uniref:Dihydrolipoamide acetyltransferase component of pyruvate dehydrogenase complex n=1 Tax=Brassica napus TaxID=3708 RepID=A0ABQ7XG03_BRANA|nr:hypothetical protein HID58_037130 [Brassica napus]
MAASSSFLSTASLSNPKSTISFASSVSPAPIPSSAASFPLSVFSPPSNDDPIQDSRDFHAGAILHHDGRQNRLLDQTEGEKLAKGESVVVVESDKADMDVETFYDGYLAAIVVGEGETAPVGAAIGLLAETEAEIEEAKNKAASKPSSSAVVPSPPPATSSPLRRSLSFSGGSGVRWITASDVEAAAGLAPTVTPPPPPPPPPAAAPAPTAKATTTSSPPLLPDASSSLHSNAISMNTDALDALYEKVKPKGVTMTALLVKAARMALAQHPVVNASCKDGKSFSYNSNINVAVAVAINGGLITPVLQDADKVINAVERCRNHVGCFGVGLYLLSQKWKELVGKARSKQLQPHEYNSGTFTLSNLGMFGVDRFDAILPPGQGAIMAVGASKPTLVADKDGFFSVKNKMLVNVTADHRIVYGADLAAFFKLCKDR